MLVDGPVVRSLSLPSIAWDMRLNGHACSGQRGQPSHSPAQAPAKRHVAEAAVPRLHRPSARDGVDVGGRIGVCNVPAIALAARTVVVEVRAQSAVKAHPAGPTCAIQ
jgi:hypothetical protein